MEFQKTKTRLLIDIGNTNIVCGVSQGLEIKKKWRTGYRLNMTKDEFGLDVINYLNYFGFKPEKVNISCVVPEILTAIINGVKDYLDIEPLVINHKLKTKLVWDIDNPAELGADRIANSIAAYEIYGGDSITVDFGTATTYDLVDTNGRFLTGITAPGLKISADALFKKASLLHETNLSLPGNILVKNTVDSLRAGIILSQIGATEYIIKKLLEYLPNARVIATGGLCNLVKTDMIDIVDVDLTLKGIMLAG